MITFPSSIKCLCSQVLFEANKSTPCSSKKQSLNSMETMNLYLLIAKHLWKQSSVEPSEKKIFPLLKLDNKLSPFWNKVFKKMV